MAALHIQIDKRPCKKCFGLVYKQKYVTKQENMASIILISVQDTIGQSLMCMVIYIVSGVGMCGVNVFVVWSTTDTSTTVYKFTFWFGQYVTNAL